MGATGGGTAPFPVKFFILHRLLCCLPHPSPSHQPTVCARKQLLHSLSQKHISKNVKTFWLSCNRNLDRNPFNRTCSHQLLWAIYRFLSDQLLPELLGISHCRLQAPSLPEKIYPDLRWCFCPKQARATLFPLAKSLWMVENGIFLQKETSFGP